MAANILLKVFLKISQNPDFLKKRIEYAGFLLAYSGILYNSNSNAQIGKLFLATCFFVCLNSWFIYLTDLVKREHSYGIHLIKIQLLLSIAGLMLESAAATFGIIQIHSILTTGT